MQYEIYWIFIPTLHSKVVWQHSNIEILEKNENSWIIIYVGHEIHNAYLDPIMVLKRSHVYELLQFLRRFINLYDIIDGVFVCLSKKYEVM